MRNSHQSNSDLEHVVAQRKVGEAIPRARRPTSHPLLRILKVLLRILVKARHRDRSLAVLVTSTVQTIDALTFPASEQAGKQALRHPR